MTRSNRNIVRNPDFSKRLIAACDEHAECPEFNSGRLAWLRGRLSERGVPVSTQSVSRWYAGETLPREGKCRVLADILNVNAAELYMGVTVDVSVGHAGSSLPAVEGKTMAMLPIPLRSDLTVEIYNLPSDLSEIEAQRIAKIVLAYALVDSES
jgi:hypothetical protein